MDVVTRKFDTGQPPHFCEHLFTLVGDELHHYTDGALRASVPAAGMADFCVDHPEAIVVAGQVVGDIETKVAEAKARRAKAFAAQRQRPTGAIEQSKIDSVVEKAVAAALAKFQEQQLAQLRASAAQ